MYGGVLHSTATGQDACVPVVAKSAQVFVQLVCRNQRLFRCGLPALLIARAHPIYNTPFCMAARSAWWWFLLRCVVGVVGLEGASRPCHGIDGCITCASGLGEPQLHKVKGRNSFL